MFQSVQHLEMKKKTNRRERVEYRGDEKSPRESLQPSEWKCRREPLGRMATEKKRGEAGWQRKRREARVHGNC